MLFSLAVSDDYHHVFVDIAAWQDGSPFSTRYIVFEIYDNQLIKTTVIEIGDNHFHVEKLYPRGKLALQCCVRVSWKPNFLD